MLDKYLSTDYVNDGDLPLHLFEYQLSAAEVKS